MVSPQQSLRDRQVASIEKILNLNHAQPELNQNGTTNGIPAQATPILNSDGDPIWKILIFDDLGRDLIASVLRVDDLRKWGVTVHMHINTTRHQIPDVPVLYLVEPTPKNLQTIVSDLTRSLYGETYINFLHSIPRTLMEDFAEQIAQSGAAESIAQVYDQYLNFVVAEPDLFSLSLGRETYWALNSAQTADDVLDSLVDKIVTGLFSVVVTMGAIPIIRCPKGEAAEMICVSLDRKLRDHILNSKDNLFSNQGQRQNQYNSTASSRPVLIVLDRNVDLVPMLSHSWTYQSLVYDVLKMRLNQITVESPTDESNPSRGSSKRSYNLDSTDFFWSRNAGVPFPQVAEDIDTELTRYKDEAAEITRKTGASSLEDLQNGDSVSTAHMKAAMDALPKLQERKKTLDMHMNIATALLKGIKDRQLDNYYQIEETITKQTKAQMLELLYDSDKGKEPLDKLRLFIIWFLSTESDVSRNEMDKFEEALKNAGCDVSALAYVKRVRDLTRMTMITSVPTQATQQSGGTDLFRGFNSISNRLTDRFRDGALGANFENLISGVKNFLPVNKDLTVTKITESIMDPASASSSAIAKTENYLYFDPRSANARGSMPPPSQARHQQSGMPGALGSMAQGSTATFGQRRQGFTEAVVFVAGGGSADEYGNLMDWAKRTSGGGSNAVAGAPRRRIVYGSTEILNAEDFLNGELARLGKESG